ncbi:hypothetical protein ACTMTJ_16765 [Phytohabitans sp. LJ34]|uniref:hypothetical protein n=1 Tax=Phytohabitans sp. LJ34 TaxID=3452217 RepID=UPI003F8B8CE4
MPSADEVLRRLLAQTSDPDEGQAADVDRAAERFAEIVPAGEQISADVAEALTRLATSLVQPGMAVTPAEPPPSPARVAFRRRAAVLSDCDPAALLPAAHRDEPQATLGELASDLVPAPAAAGHNRWMLRPELRRETLGELGTREALVAELEAVPERPADDPMQRAFEGQITGAAPPLAEQSVDDLSRTLQAVRWLEGTQLPLPEPEEIRRLIEEKRLVSTFEQLAEHFVSRSDELRRLSDYVGVRPPSTAAASFRASVRDLLDRPQRPALMYYAPGGVGKSTLIAKFLLDHATVAPELRFPYAYLDFDNPALVAARPVTLLREAARQLAVQYPSGRTTLEEFVADVERMVEREPEAESEAPASLHASRRSAAAEGRQSKLYSEFARIVRRLARRTDDEGTYHLPLLIVVDTYEEVQNRGVEHELRLWSLLDTLREEFPRLRLVVFGRVPLDAVPTTGEALRPKPLHEFDEESATELLRRMGVAPDAAAEIHHDVGGNPLSLKLAALVYRKEREAGSDRTGIERLDTTRLLFFSAGENVVQGQLYQRILRHIKDPDVRRLAHPGLVLRRITPQIIREVLQEPCGVAVPTDERARELFEALRREAALVTVEPDGALRHRPDVRRVMLKLIRRDKPEQVAEIDRLAVRYYAGHPELSPATQARAEEIYHRLQLTQPAEVIEERWLDGVEEDLRGALDELPVVGQAVLATRLGIRLPEEVLRQADTQEWEEYAARLAEESINQGHYDTALRELRERSTRRWSAASPLHLLRARALALLGDWPEAEACVRLAIRAASRSGDRARMVDTLLLAAQISRELRHREAAEEQLAQAHQLATLLADPVRHLRVHLERLELTPTPALRESLARALAGLSDEEWRAHTGLVRSGVAAVGFDHPDLLLRLMRTIGAARLTAGQRDLLAELLAEVVPQDLRAWERTTAFARTIRLSVKPSHESMRELLERLQDAGRLSEFYEQLIPLLAADSRSRELGSAVLARLFLTPEESP